MGYEIGAKVYKLVFADGQFEGLEVRARSMPLGEFLELAELIDAGGFTGDGAREIFARFSKVLVSWNCEKRGKPVPTTVAGLLRLDLAEAGGIIEAWRDVITGVTGPLEQNSTGGEPSPEVSIPMEPLTASQAS